MSVRPAFIARSLSRIVVLPQNFRIRMVLNANELRAIRELDKRSFDEWNIGFQKRRNREDWLRWRQCPAMFTVNPDGVENLNLLAKSSRGF